MLRRTLLLVALLVVAGAVAPLPATALSGGGPAPAAAGAAAWGPTAAVGGDTLAATDEGADCSYPLTRTDATGAEVTVEAPPERVVALGPSAAQTMWDVGGREQVVGMPVNRYTNYLEGAEERANVMNPDLFTIDVERVVDLEPDLVLAPNVIGDDTVAQLRQSGLAVYKFRFAADLEDVEDKTLLTGHLTGNCEGAEERVAWMEDRLATVRAAVEGEPRPRVVYPVGGGFVAGEGTFLDEILRTAGGRNVAAAANISGYGRLSVEVIVTSDPEWLVLNEGLPRSAIQSYAYNHTTAGRADQVVRVDPNYANQPAPRVVIAVETIARALHPEAFAAANGTASPTATATATTQPDSTAGGASGGTDAPGQPGFGAGAAVVALLVVVAASRVASRRR